jgi:polyisoprenyl-phosphate glycosyltransferase
MNSATNRIEISVVAPVFNSAGTIPELCKRTREALAALGVTHELIFVDDGSSDGSFAALCHERKADPSIRAIKLVRNFGQHPAITAGLLHSMGAWVVLMDDDLQTPPEEIGKLYAKAREGFDIVCGARAERQDGAARRAGSRVAHWLMQRLFEEQSEDVVSSFRIISRRVVDAYLRLPEKHTYVAALMSWLGYPHTSVPVRHEASAVRRSRYSYRKLLKIWFDMAFGFSDRPLKVAAWTGVVFSVLAAILGARVVVLYLVSEHPVPGYASLFVSQMFFFGVTLVFMGVLGEYVARIYREVKQRPYFLIDYEQSVGLTERRDAGGRLPGS